MKNLFLILLVMTSMKITAQSERDLFVSCYFEGVNPSVKLKWYSPELTYQEGVSIYRREKGTLSWFKINNEPIRGRMIRTSEAKNDEELPFYFELAKSENRESLEEGFLMLNLLIKTFQSNLLSEVLGIYYVDQNVEPGKIYEYRVNKIIGNREVLIAISNPVRVEKEKSRTEYKFEVFENKEGVAFDWEVKEKKYYGVNIYYQRTDSMKTVKINTNPVLVSLSKDSLGALSYPNPKFLLKDVIKGKEYRFWIRGSGYFGEELSPSDTLVVRINDHEAPPPPENFKGKADSMKVRLSWNASATADLKEHSVLRSRLSDGPFKPVYHCFTCSSFVDEVTIPGPYYYQVMATDHTGNIAYSRKIFVEVQDVIPPAPPQNLVIRSDTGRFTLTWAANTEPDLAGYYLYRTVDRDDPSHYVFLNSEPLDTSYYVQDLPKITKNKFYYYVVAVDTSYNRSKPSEVAAGTLPDVHSPRQPFILNVRHTKNGARITWKPVLDPDLAGYELYRSDSTTLRNFQNVQEKILSRVDTSYLDPTVKPGMDYLYQLVARDSAGNASSPSTPFYYLSPASSDRADIRVSLTVNYKKRRQEARLRWETTEKTDDLLGYVVYNSADTVRLRPATGLLKANTWTQPLSEEEDPYYQVRMYLQDGRCYRSEVMKVK